MRILIVLLVAAAAGLGAQSQTLPGSTRQHGGFALPDPKGARLLLMPYTDPKVADPITFARPELLTTAICSGGRRVPVQFERRQTAGEYDGRASSRNFDRLGGSVFRVLERTFDPEAPCFLAAESLLAGAAILSISAAPESSACLKPERFGTLRNRPVVKCWPIARVAVRQQVVLLEFERRGKDALAAFALIDGDRVVFADVPAEYQGPGESLWRVDDEGVLSPQGITIVCALQRDGWYALGTAWSGAEGLLLSLWVTDGSDRFTKVLNDYRYQAPR